MVSQITFSGGDTISYAYDAEERITSVVETYTDGEDQIVRTTQYTYDALGQLLTETVNGTVVNTMTYDNYGNILTKNGIPYTYGDSAWKDKLTAYNGQTITYDAQGNPLKYRGHTLTWEKGRQLKTFDGNTYTYNANGIRTSKTVNTGKHEYILDGTKILRETWGNNTLVPLYDNEDSVCGILYNDEPFYFRKNLQGDIIAIVDDQADVVARYSYDAWGVPTTLFDTSGCSIATINPFRYRGYYYDPETQLYYLQSRYYDPVVGRLISSDDATVLLFQHSRDSLNLWSYVYNTPVIFKDIMGYSGVLVIAGGVTISLGQALAYLAGAAALVAALALIFDAGFRRYLTQVFATVRTYVIDTVDYLKTVIAEVVTVAKKSRQYSGNEDHHIVAHTDPRADWSRKLLQRYELSPWGIYNVVSIKKTLHKHLHTSAYHFGVYLFLKNQELKGKNKSQRKAYVLSGLIVISVLLKIASNAMS